MVLECAQIAAVVEGKSLQQGSAHLQLGVEAGQRPPGEP